MLNSFSFSSVVFTAIFVFSVSFLNCVQASSSGCDFVDFNDGDGSCFLVVIFGSAGTGGGAGRGAAGRGGAEI